MIPADATGASDATNALAGTYTPCERARELLGRLNRSSAEADTALIGEVADHFDRCARCHEDEEAVEELVALYRSSGSSHGIPLPPSLEQRLLDLVCGQDGRDTGDTGNIDREGTKGIKRMETVKQLENSSGYGFGTSLQVPIDEAIERVTAALKEEGFGVLTTIDVRQTMKQKLDIEFEPYFILGACNPSLAHRALEAVHDVGLLLPCNVIVHAHGEQTRVEIADPIAMLGIVKTSELESIAQEARSRLKNVIQRLEAEQA
jgi:uncharacterized protein (DUF302 family)